MRDTGIDVANRQSRVVEHENGAYSFVVWGDDALDCHVYPQPVLQDMYTVAANDTNTPLGRIFAGEYATFFVEAAPVPNEHDPAQAIRVARAVSELLTDETLALYHFSTHRVAVVTPKTKDLLQTGDISAVMKDGIELKRRV